MGTLHTIRLGNGSWPFPFAEVPPATQLTIPTNSCATNKVGDLHLLVMGYESVGAGLFLKLRHTVRLANGNWPHPFGDVQAAINQGNIQIAERYDVIACATNQGGDLHLLVIDASLKLWHTVRLANGDWPYPFGDVQAAINQGNIGQISAVACATDQTGDLHVCVRDSNDTLRHTIRLANGSWPYPFGDVQAAINQGNIGQISAVACATDQTGDLHICVRDSTGKLRHTIRLANGDWPHPFGDIEAAINQGNIGQIFDIACATNQAGDLHVCATNGVFIT